VHVFNEVGVFGKLGALSSASAFQKEEHGVIENVIEIVAWLEE
jgi:hypothetical protein